MPTRSVSSTRSSIRLYRICFFFQAEDGIRDADVTGVQTCALPILRPYLVQCYDRKDFPRTVPRHGTQHSGPQDAVSPHQWSQELERLSVALRALRGVCGLVGARCGPSKISGAARCPARPRSLARTATGDDRRPQRATDALSLSPQTPGLSHL